MEAQVDVNQEKNVVKVNITGKDAAILIGRRGETLDSYSIFSRVSFKQSKKTHTLRYLLT
ncbi:KH domain-containing protein [Paraclostridium bifermentans]|nr:KH domain-containing protein [Paraclostridium bifermentans]